MPGVFSEHLNMTVTHLRRKENPMLYAATEMLMTRPDLFPCDKKGNILGVNTPVAAGIHPVHPTTPDLSLENIAKALGAPLEVVQAMAKGKTVSEIEADAGAAAKATGKTEVIAASEEVPADAGISPVAETAGVEPPVLDGPIEKTEPVFPEPGKVLDEEAKREGQENKAEEFVFDPEGSWSTYNRADMVKWAVEKHGEQAATIDPEWSRKDIMLAIETLEVPPEGPPVSE